MSVHPDKTAWRAVDACGGVYSPEQEASGYADGHRDALDDACREVRAADALTAELLEAIKPLAPADDDMAMRFSCMDPEELVPVTIPVRCILQARAAIAKATGVSG